MAKAIKWQAPGSDVVHEIPERAEVVFETELGLLSIVITESGELDICCTETPALQEFKIICELSNQEKK